MIRNKTLVTLDTIKKIVSISTRLDTNYNFGTFEYKHLGAKRVTNRKKNKEIRRKINLRKILCIYTFF